MTKSVVSQEPPLDISRALHGLFNEVIGGTAHLNAAKSLGRAAQCHPVMMRASPSFFRLTTDAHLEAAQLAAARLFDDHKDCASIPWLLTQAKYHRREFLGTEKEFDQAISHAERTCAAMAAVLSAIEHRRDRWLAHLDRKTIRNREQFVIDARLTYKELEQLFASTTEILNELATLHGDAGHLIFDDDYDDLPRTLELIEKGAEANALELEVDKQEGPPPWRRP